MSWLITATICGTALMICAMVVWIMYQPVRIHRERVAQELRLERERHAIDMDERRAELMERSMAALQRADGLEKDTVIQLVRAGETQAVKLETQVVKR